MKCRRRIISLMFIAAMASGTLALGVSHVEPDDCSDHQLDECVDNLPGPKQFGIPRNQKMLDRHCKQYHFGMGCMDKWMERCISGDQQKIMRARTAGVRSLMVLMCNTTAFRREYLKEESCWSAVSADLSRCIDALHVNSATAAAADVDEVNAQLCCARDDFDRCVVRATRSRCSAGATAMLRRMARLVTGDGGACAARPHPHARCASSAPSAAALLLAALGAASAFS